MRKNTNCSPEKKKLHHKEQQAKGRVDRIYCVYKRFKTLRPSKKLLLGK